MNELLAGWSYRDLRFVVDTLIPGRPDPEHLVALLQDDDELLTAMLEDERLFRELMADDEILVSVSPHFFFKVLLLRARRDLERQVYTFERRNLQQVVLFDANRVVELLSRPEVCNYLAALLASFTRLQNLDVLVQVRPGDWHRLRVRDLDVDSLIRYAQIADPDQQLRVYCRIADTCLFLAAVFPEYIESQQRYPHSGAPRPRLTTTLLHTLDDFESYGRTFYRLAAQHRLAAREGLAPVLEALAEQFVLAGKPLTFVAEHYLAMRKHRLFGLSD